ncbi:RrF2 family transcriptional regulator [Levilactobacillus sp. N40-8-2]|uniref:RrF2 family transcriptional regulator n=1 Tax=Levilactobacillus muriae TaxID=3238987 RepID=UPI0038B2D489
MKAKPSLEQAFCIVALLGIQDRKIPLHSRLVAERLDISTSYLKKIVQKLSAAEIVKTVSGRDGGIVLTKDPLKITLLDIFNAIEGTTPLVHNTGLASKVFGLDKKEAFIQAYQLEDFKDTQPVSNVLAVFAQAEEKFRQELATLSIGEVIPTTADQPLQLDWTKWLTR